VDVPQRRVAPTAEGVAQLPLPGLPDWWPADVSSWTAGENAGETSEGARQHEADPAVAPEPEPATTWTAPVLHRRIRPIRDPASGSPVSRRVPWPLHGAAQRPTGAPGDTDLSGDRGPDPDPRPGAPAPAPPPDDGSRGATSPGQERDATRVGPAAPGIESPSMLGPVLRRVVRGAVATPDGPRHPGVERPDLPNQPRPFQGDVPELLQAPEPPQPPDRAPVGVADGRELPPAPAALGTSGTAAPVAKAAAGAPTAEDVADRLRHRLLVERERFGVLADLW
jgi:hypothetical protein